jgi:predicted deacetylase
MRYVIIRDDDTNALTPVECLERLYRPFLDRNLPVNLAVIPNVATGTTLPDGRREGFLLGRKENAAETVPIGSNPELVRYLQSNPGYRIVQHGFRHDYFEFDRLSSAEVCDRLEQGTQLLTAAGFERPRTFVAPYDKLSRESMREVARRFPVVSTGWFELRRLPLTWWPLYLAKKARHAPHWRVGKTALLSHPGCILSCHREYATMLQKVIETVNSRRLTVLVTHWWEYFRNGEPDDAFIGFLHATAEYLAGNPDVKVISFDDLAETEMQLN